MGGREAVRLASSYDRAFHRALAWKLVDAGSTTVKAEDFLAKNAMGFVYIIGHPKFSGRYKIGRACDPIQRLNSFQTGCPERAYELITSVYFHDCIFAEAELHARLSDYRLAGEWFAVPVSEAMDALYELRQIL